MIVWLDKHPYVLIYLIGCAASLLAYLIYAVFLFAFKWITKANIFKKNLKKIHLPYNDPLTENFYTVIFGVIVNILLSWLGVLLIFIQLLILILRIIRELFVSTPEELKQLRYPLFNNPSLYPESVWTHMYALSVKTGVKVPDMSAILYELNEIKEYHPKFNIDTSINMLAGLNVIAEDLIKAVREEREGVKAFESIENEFDNV